MFIVCGLAILHFQGSSYATGPLNATLLLLAVVVGSYVLLTMIVPPRTGVAEVAVSTRRAVLWIQFGIMVAAFVATLAFVPTTASLELIKRLFVYQYAPSYDPLQIRLSTAYMPIWSQGLLEFARRIAAPYCMIELLFGGMRRHMHFLFAMVTFLLLTFFVLATLERAIGVLYFAACIAAIATTKGLRATFTDKYTYVCLAGIICVVVIFKQIQYGDFTPISLTKNPEISRELSAGIPPRVHNSEKVPNGPEIAPNNSKATRYLYYFADSVAERIFLSPVAMIIYASQNYDPSNYRHWTATRIFSFLGYGEYLPPLETAANGKAPKEHNDAFPLTFIGDLWRNGGPIYFPYYAALLGLVFFLLDRYVFASSSLAALKVCGTFSILFLFYGNAFNATTLMSIVTCLTLAIIMPRFFGSGDLDTTNNQ